jgi:hypothetical protein
MATGEIAVEPVPHRRHFVCVALRCGKSNAVGRSAHFVHDFDRATDLGNRFSAKPAQS